MNFFVFGGCLGGGGDDAVTTNDLWKYSMDGKSWSLLSQAQDDIGYTDGSIPGSRRFPSINHHEGSLYVFGGCGDKEEFFLLNDLWEFDLERNEWNPVERHEFNYTSDAGAPPVRYGHSATTYQDNLYIFAGWYRHHKTKEHQCLNDFWRYNLESRIWSRIHPEEEEDSKIPPRRYGAMSARVGSRFYIWGGWNSSGDLNDLWMYDLDQKSWECIQNKDADGRVPEPRYCGSMVEVNGDLVLISGRSRSVPEKRYADVWRFDTEEREWLELEKCAIENRGPCYLGKAAYAKVDGKMVIFGGERLSKETGRSHSNSVWIYNADDEEWEVTNQEAG